MKGGRELGGGVGLIVEVYREVVTIGEIVGSVMVQQPGFEWLLLPLELLFPVFSDDESS